MPDPAPDAPQSPAPAVTDEHVPWDSIDSEDQASEVEQPAAEAMVTTEDPQLPLTPWAAGPSAAPDSPAAEDAETDESGAALRALEEWAESEDGPPPGEEEPVDEYALLAIRPKVAPELPPSRGGGWTLPVLCAGIALIACCVLIPQTDANRRLAYEHESLQRDLQTLEQQIKVNDEFLKKVADDPELAQRLAERQMKVIPEGAHVLDLTHDQGGMSPFQLVNVPPPPPLPPYQPAGGTLAHLCYGPHSRLYLIGVSLCMIATGLVLGGAPAHE